jgi:adenylosuccinate lyase
MNFQASNIKDWHDMRNNQVNLLIKANNMINASMKDFEREVMGLRKQRELEEDF